MMFHREYHGCIYIYNLFPRIRPTSSVPHSTGLAMKPLVTSSPGRFSHPKVWEDPKLNRQGSCTTVVGIRACQGVQVRKTHDYSLHFEPQWVVSIDSRHTTTWQSYSMISHSFRVACITCSKLNDQADLDMSSAPTPHEKAKCLDRDIETIHVNEPHHWGGWSSCDPGNHCPTV